MPSERLSRGLDTDSGTYPGGKSGAGIYQRLINLIPRHRILISAFAGRCGVVRNIRPAELTIVIDADADVCQWWDDWQRKPFGRSLEIYCCDSLTWLEHKFQLFRFPRVPRDHRVPTRGGLQDEVIWMNYDRPSHLQDYRYIGKCRRSRERIRRRQVNWLKQLRSMGEREAAAMLDFLNWEFQS